MKRYHITDGVQILLAILMTGSMAYAMQPTVVKQPSSQHTVVQTKQAPKKPITKPREKPVERPKVQKPVTWQDNPNHCTDAQYIGKDAPFACIDKPKPVQPVQKPAAQPAANDGSAKAFIYARESGNNPGAVNASSGACGLGQALPCNKMPCSLADYACQDAYFTEYMQSRYGTWENAKIFWLQHNWW